MNFHENLWTQFPNAQRKDIENASHNCWRNEQHHQNDLLDALKHAFRKAHMYSQRMPSVCSQSILFWLHRCIHCKHSKDLTWSILILHARTQYVRNAERNETESRFPIDPSIFISFLFFFNLLQFNIEFHSSVRFTSIFSIVRLVIFIVRSPVYLCFASSLSLQFNYSQNVNLFLQYHHHYTIWAFLFGWWTSLLSPILFVLFRTIVVENCS